MEEESKEQGESDKKKTRELSEEEKEAKITFIGRYLLASLLVLMAAPIVAYYIDFWNEFIRTMIYLGSSGGIGGTVYCIRGFYYWRREGKFDVSFDWWYYFRPFISVVAGVYVYFFIVGGFLVTGLAADADYSRGVMFYCAVSFLAGFSFNEFIEKLTDISETIFSKKKKDESDNDTNK